MRLFYQELKKLYIKHKIIFLAALLFLISVFTMMNKEMLPVIVGQIDLTIYGEVLEKMGTTLYAFQEFLSETGINIYALIFSLSIAVITVYTEEKNEMGSLLQTSKYGRAKLHRVKVIIVIVSCFLFCSLIFLTDFLINSIKYSFPDMHLSLQSLESYAETQKSLTLLQAIALKYICQTIGYIVIGLITMCLVKVFKGKTAIALTISLGILLIPLYLGETTYNTERLYLLPTPLSLMLSGAFLNPTIIYDGSDDVYFKEITYGQILAVTGVIVLVGVISMGIYLYLSSGKGIGKAKIKRKKPLVALLVCVSILFMSGCTATPITVSTQDQGNIMMEDFKYYFDAKTKTVKSVCSTPMEDSYLLFIQGDTAFLSKSENSFSSGLDLYALNLVTYEEKHLFNSGNLNDYDGLLGLDNLFPSIGRNNVKWNFPHISEGSWYSNGHIYAFTNTDIKSIDIKTGSVEDCLKGYSITYVKRKNDKVYIADKEKGLFEADLNLENLKLIDEKAKTFLFNACGDKVFYEIPEDLSTIYLAGKNEPYMTTEFPVRLLYATDKKLILENEKDASYYFIDTSSDDAVLTKICDYHGGEFSYADDEFLYFSYYESNYEEDDTLIVFWIGYDGKIYE